MTTALHREQVYSRLQSTFVRGLVTVIGSGISCGLGLPGMGSLAEHLLTEVPERLAADGQAAEDWAGVSAKLHEGMGLEAAMRGIEDGSPLVSHVSYLTARFISMDEGRVIARLAVGSQQPALGVLLRHIVAASSQACDVITPNYDRLIEYCASMAGVRVDTSFYGHALGRFDERRSRDELLLAVTRAGRREHADLSWHPHVRLAKPHGSLDWFEVQGVPLRSDLPLEARRLIVVPGGSKYRAGYDVPFDAHRERANRAIDQANQLLFLGYGFNDDHLEVHLRSRLAAGTPAVIMTRTLSPNARACLTHNPRVLALEKSPETASGTRVLSGDSELLLPGEDLWQIDSLVNEVLGLYD